MLSKYFYSLCFRIHNCGFVKSRFVKRLKLFFGRLQETWFRTIALLLINFCWPLIKIKILKTYGFSTCTDIIQFFFPSLLWLFIILLFHIFISRSWQPLLFFKDQWCVLLFFFALLNLFQQEQARLFFHIRLLFHLFLAFLSFFNFFRFFYLGLLGFEFLFEASTSLNLILCNLFYKALYLVYKAW